MPPRSANSVVQDVCAWVLATLPEIRTSKIFPATENPGLLPELTAKTLRILPNKPSTRTTAMSRAPATAHAPHGRGIELGLAILISPHPESKSEPSLRDMADRLIWAQDADPTLGKTLGSSPPECGFPPVETWTDGSSFAQLTVAMTVTVIP